MKTDHDYPSLVLLKRSKNKLSKFICGFQWPIQGFPGGANPKVLLFCNFFAENCMKMKEFGPQGEGARSWRPLDPPMVLLLDTSVGYE